MTDGRMRDARIVQAIPRDSSRFLAIPRDRSKARIPLDGSARSLTRDMIESRLLMSPEKGKSSSRRQLDERAGGALA